MVKALFPVLIISAICFSCKNHSTVSDADGLDAFSADSMGKNISILASDSFKGRMPFTPSETMTINFMSKAFASAGLEPGNGDSYFQDVPMVNIFTTAAPAMQAAGPKGKLTLKGLDDYVIWTDKTDSVITLDNNELIFAGYGV